LIGQAAISNGEAIAMNFEQESDKALQEEQQ
jgi:hypothetical protein